MLLSKNPKIWNKMMVYFLTLVKGIFPISPVDPPMIINIIYFDCLSKQYYYHR